MQLTLDIVDEACLADVRNRILMAWPAHGYQNGYHKANSLEKNIGTGVRKLSDCEDIDVLGEYLAHVEGKKDE